jgi:hypothetical protein
VSDGGGESEDLLRREIGVMAPQRFEQLVFELAHREDAQVRRVANPDGGADVIRQNADGTCSRAWQAKRYADDINWQECESSLTSVIKRWEPSEVTFAFARDLSQQHEKAFAERLVSHPDAVATETRITLWNLSEIVRRLAEHPDLRVRFFGKQQESMDAALARTISAGGALESAGDLVDRARTLSGWAEQDPDFTHSINAAALEVPAPSWGDELPYMTLEVNDAKTRVTIAAWPRDGAALAPPTMMFGTDAPSQAVRREAVAMLARGEPAVVTEGFQIRANTPEIVQALTSEGGLQAGEATIVPSEPTTLDIEATTDGGVVSRSVDLYAVPPPPGAAAAFAGYAGSALLEVTVTLLEKPNVHLDFSLSARFGQDARANADAAELLHAFYTHDRLVMRNDHLLPGGESTQSMDRDGLSDEKLQELTALGEFFEGLATVNEQLGLSLTAPPTITDADFGVLREVVSALVTGSGRQRFEQTSGMVSATDIATIAERLSGQTISQPVVFELLGQQVTIGVGEYDLPQLRVVGVFPHGDLPTSPARVVLEADGDPEMVFRLSNGARRVPD